MAGPAALLVAKLHKIDDRQGTGRQSDKDALDAFRLLRGTDTDDLAARFRTLLEDSKSAEVAEAAVSLLRTQFGTRAGVGIEMATRSAGPLADADELAGSSLALADELHPRFTDMQIAGRSLVPWADPEESRQFKRWVADHACRREQTDCRRACLSGPSGQQRDQCEQRCDDRLPVCMNSYQMQ